MKKTLLAIAIPALLVANAATATELYADKSNTLSLGGHLSAGLAGSDEGSTGVHYNSPRINIAATSELGYGITADAKVEWAINMKGGERALSTRLGYLGLSHDAYGRVVVGTQWAPTIDVAGVTDMPIAFANDFLYADHGNLGTGRANDMVSYRKGFTFSDDLALNLGFGVQGSHTDESNAFIDDVYTEDAIKNSYGARYQAAVGFVFAEYQLGLAYNTGDVTYNGQREETATIANVSAKYGTYGKGLYVAAVYAENEFVADFDDKTAIASESTNMELLASYGFANATTVSVNYEVMTNDDLDQDSMETTALSVEYSFTPSIVGYAGYQIDLTDADDNAWNIGGRIYL